MAITVNLYYHGENNNALQFVKEMIESKTVEKIKNEKGNLKYDYFISYQDPNTVLLIDSWENQEAIDNHHKSEMMQTIAKLRDKYDLHMTMERYVSDNNIPQTDKEFLRK